MSFQRVASKAPLVPNKSKSTSIFLTHLPGEIRTHIYEYVFSGHRSFLFIRTNYTRAPIAHSDDRNIHIASHEWNSYPFVTHSGLNLLRTCRKVYTEGLAVALSSHIFYLRGPPHFDSLSNRLLRLFSARRLNLIRHFEVQWFYCSGLDYRPNCEYPVGEVETWEHIWTFIATEMRLSSIEIRLVYGGPVDQMHVDAPWLQPLHQIRGVKSVKVDIRRYRNETLVEPALNKALGDVMSAGVSALSMLPCSSKSRFA